ncbi:hypothetical protein K466DRAFT_635286 [Polyporus arcularius HHB13444]|uniref:Uncharacterized protein n=1 Tax=Polyporus arcularius HHB13444 TaxID=1314778 RepID=A0A5C3NW85_9APHY|nr:hypothetical protein K466DRAFT_635286 [Polyporus arcularius HHB13444]
MIVTIDLATLVAFLALALAAHLYIRLLGRGLPDEQRRAGGRDDYPNSDGARNVVPGGHGTQSDARQVKGASGKAVAAHTADELSEDAEAAAAGPSRVGALSQTEGSSTGRAHSSKPIAMQPPTAPARMASRAADVVAAGPPSKVNRSSSPAESPLSRRQYLAAFPPSIPGSPPPHQRLMAAHPRPVPSSSAVKMDVDPPAGQRKGKARARADSPVPAKVSFTTPRVPISVMSTLTSIPTVSSRSTTPGSSMTLLVHDDDGDDDDNDDEMEVDQQLLNQFYTRIVKHRSLPLKPGQVVADVVTTTWFCSQGQDSIVQPPSDVHLEKPTVGDIFRHRVDKYTPPQFQLFLRVLRDDGKPGWLEVDEGIRRDDGMWLIVTPSTEEVSWVGESHYRAVMRKSGNFRSRLRLAIFASEESSLSSLSDA